MLSVVRKMAARSLFLLLFVVAARVFSVISVEEQNVTERQFNDQFEEELFLKPLPNGYVYSQFQFTTKWDVDAADPAYYKHYRLFPKSLGGILEKYGVKELHLSLTQGLWKHQIWGYPVVDAPPGAELWVWFNPDTKDVDETWIGLSNALSGLFCASLNFVDASNTISPRISFRPNGLVGDAYAKNSSLLRYASIPREVVCTENLTPWKKLLPCSTAAGLSTLLNARQLFDVHYHSMGVHVRRVCRNSKCIAPNSLELSQTLAVVSELSRHYGDKQDWSLRKLFGSMLFRSCPLATTSAVYVDLSANSSSSTFTLAPLPSKLVNNGRKVTLAVYHLDELLSEESSPLNIAATYAHPLSYSVVPAPNLYANRYIKGYGKQSGKIHTIIRHLRSSLPLQIVYLEQVPHFARIYLHTLKITSNGKPLTPDFMHVTERIHNTEQPFLMEAIITLPPNSVTEIQLFFEREYLKYSAYPPDANRGFYIGPAVISARIPSAWNYTSGSQRISGIHPELHSLENGYFVRVHTETLLLAVPTPDFSMPYNVICMVCTVVALAFGPIYNVTTKRLTAKISKNVGLLSKLFRK